MRDGLRVRAAIFGSVQPCEKSGLGAVVMLAETFRGNSAWPRSKLPSPNSVHIIGTLPDLAVEVREHRVGESFARLFGVG